MKDIAEEVYKVLKFSQPEKISKEAVEKNVNSWYEAKKNMIDKYFGGELIYEYPEKISFEINESEKENKITEFCSDIREKWNNEQLADFVMSEKNNFYTNIVANDYNDNIKKGNKIIKAFRYFEKNKETLNEIQSKASMLIQENKVSGTLCFSVHPLDYLSSSENNCNWHTCQSLNGDYRAGTMSYMLDKVTIVCYLKSDEDVNLPHFPEDMKWNNKKWRMLLFKAEDDTIFFAGRQYPFFSKSALETLKPIICKFFHLHSWDYSNFSNAQVTAVPCGDMILDLTSPHIYIKGQLVSLKDVVCDTIRPLHYNDLLYSTEYVPYYSYNIWNKKIKDINIEIGAPVTCIQCGKDEVYSSERMVCEDCYTKEFGRDIYYYCDCCGQKIRVECCNFHNHMILCENCYNNINTICEKD